MRRHRFDPLSFIFGIAFLLVAGALSIDGINLTGGWIRWTAAGLLLLFGIVMVFGSRSRSHQAHTDA